MPVSLQQTAASNENKTLKQPWRNKQFVDIWRWCRTPFESYRPQLCGGSDNIRFIFNFLVRETHKAVCVIRGCKKKTQILRGEKKNEEIISRNCQPHHKRASSFMNTYKAVRLHFLPMLSRYSRMSERVQHEERCSSLYDRCGFRYDEQRSTLHTEGLMTTIHCSNVSLPSSGQQVTARLSACKVSFARGQQAQDPLVRDTT
jgi:hypothetical protein